METLVAPGDTFNLSDSDFAIHCYHEDSLPFHKQENTGNETLMISPSAKQNAGEELRSDLVLKMLMK